MKKFNFIIAAVLCINLFPLSGLFGQDDKETWAEFGEKMAEFGVKLSEQVQESMANIDMSEINEALELAQDKLNHAQLNMKNAMSNMGEHKSWSQSDINKTFTVSKGGELSVNIISGDVSITTWDRNEVSITASIFDEEETEGLKIEQEGNKIVVEHRSSWGSSTNLDIKIPSEFNLNISTTSGDIQTAGNVTGNITAQTMGGDIVFGNVNGSIHVETSGGDIMVGDVKGENKFSTMGGDVKVGSVSGKVLEIQTMGGDIEVAWASNGLNAKTYGGDITAENVKGDAVAVTYGGDIEIKTLNGDADLDTKGGDIRVDKGTGKVIAKTAGGDISFEYLEGSIKAKTASGSIYAALIPTAGGDNYINASHGEITLAFPDNAKATVNVSVRLRGWGFDEEGDEEQTGITSDFQEVSSDTGNNNKDIKKTFSVNGGGVAVNIEATNSEVNVIKYTGQREKGNRRD